MNITRPALFAIVVANFTNLLSNWVFVFGHLGMPALGVAGSGYSTALARWLMLLLLIGVSARILRPYGRAPGGGA